jgi:hypothetical protein
VYGSVTPEQVELGTNEDGKKKVYTDCKDYKDYTESKGISKEDADFNTDAVDNRIGVLINIVSVNEKYLEELDCLQAIRAIENNAEKAMHETATDMIKGIEAFQTLNEMDKKYDVRN